MEDAYEIGIRLVLENGVSAGIAVLQNDLAAYDRALAATTGRLRTVTEAGRGMKAPVGQSGAGSVVPDAARRAEAEVPDAGQRHVPVTAPAMPLPAASFQAPTAASSVAVAAPATLPPVALPVPSMPQAALPGRIPGLLQVRQRSPAAPEQPVRAKAEAEAQQTVPPLRHGPATAALMVMAVPPPPPRYARYAPTPAAGQRPAVATPDGPDGRTMPVAAPDRREDPPAPLAVRALFRSSAWNAPPTGADPASAGAQVAPRPANATAAAATPAAPVAAAASSGPVRGDVYLDGARVGRWMSDRLAREADRPQAGVTGFDPRLGPAWPGSLHGT